MFLRPVRRTRDPALFVPIKALQRMAGRRAARAGLEPTTSGVQRAFPLRREDLVHELGLGSEIGVVTRRVLCRVRLAICVLLACVAVAVVGKGEFVFLKPFYIVVVFYRLSSFIIGLSCAL